MTQYPPPRTYASSWWTWIANVTWRLSSWAVQRTTTRKQLRHLNSEHEHQNPVSDERVLWAGRTYVFTNGKRIGWTRRYGVCLGGMDVGIVLSRMPPTLNGLCEHHVRIGVDSSADVTKILSKSMYAPDVCPPHVLRAVAHRKILYAQLTGRCCDGGKRLVVDITRWLNARLLSFVRDSPWYSGVSPVDIVSVLIASGAINYTWLGADDIELSLLDGNLTDARIICSDAVVWPITSGSAGQQH